MKKYNKEDLTVMWQHSKCMHSKKCWKELGEVFKPMDRPWIDMDGASKDRIIDQVKRCPSGALTFKIEGEESSKTGAIKSITFTSNGPILLTGPVSLVLSNGEEITEEGNVALCRCGASKKKPYCDGSHKAAGFED